VTETLPAGWYRDPAVLDLERQRIFWREWQYAAASSQLASAGDVVTTDVAGREVLVVRDDTGAIHAFHNVCRHRASPLVQARTASCAGGLVCPYHGWRYGLDGGLRRARDFGEDVGDLPLLPVRCETWRGLVFVNLDLDATPLAASLGAFGDELDAYDVEAFQVVAESSHVLRCNWKTYGDNYGEGYHIPFVHPELNRQIDGRAYRVEVFDRWTRHSAPTRDGAPKSGRWLWRHPNLALNVYADGMNVERFTPVDATRTRVDYTFLFREGCVDDESMKLSEELLAEDAAICEAVQRNLDAGVYDTGVLSPAHEAGVALFHRLVREAIS
jgi:choline monooxygenase